jgi:hypothetical protein
MLKPSPDDITDMKRQRRADPERYPSNPATDQGGLKGQHQTGTWAQSKNQINDFGSAQWWRRSPKQKGKFAQDDR